MNYTLTADIVGAKELSEAFAKAPTVVSSALKNAIAKTAYRVQAKAIEYAPIRYGGLRGSIRVEGPNVTTSNVTARVGTDLPYAVYQEFGTGVYAGKGMITPKTARVLAWKDRTGWHFAKAVKGVRGKFYFKKAKEEAKPFLTNALSDALGEIISFLKKG